MYLFLLLREKYIADIRTISITNLYRQTVPALKIVNPKIVNENNQARTQKIALH